jgi:ribosomal protein L23
MPFKSKAQQRYMFATNPKAAKEMASKTSKRMFETLPDKVKPKKGKKGKMQIMLMALGKMSEPKK